jgi:hypothetical protein
VVREPEGVGDQDPRSNTEVHVEPALSCGSLVRAEQVRHNFDRRPDPVHDRELREVTGEHEVVHRAAHAELDGVPRSL